MTAAVRARRFHLLDLTALVVGYGMAALFLRVVWPTGTPPAPVEIAVIALFYIWLGLAMSGPVVLLIHPPTEPLANDQPGKKDVAPPARPCTGAELAWMMIGTYWIIMTALFVSLRGDPTRLSTPLLGLFPVVGVLGLVVALFRVLERGTPKPLREREQEQEQRNRLTQAWTHRAAVGLLITWPIAWGALILIGKTLL